MPRPLAIVGGGAAGMAAAVEAARCGLPSIVLDESAAPEGPPREVADRVRVIAGAAVLGLSADREVLWAGGGTTGTFRADRIILATGGSPRRVPFPGWTLPGVIAAEEVDTAAIRPGTGVLVAGAGPQLGLARKLRDAGAEVVAVLEAATPPRGHADRAGGLPVFSGHTIFAALGRESVEGAIFGPVDPEDWRPLKDNIRSRTVAVDWIVVDFGKVARDELAALAGCRMRHDVASGGWLPVRDPFQRTTVPGTFSAGSGVGWLVAEDEGRIAGITAAEDAGMIPRDEADERRRGPLRRLLALAEAGARPDEAPPLRPGLLDLAEPGTILCRCEAVTLADVRSAVDQGARDLSSLKLLTRLGMGPCQGRECGPCAGAILARETRRTPEEVGRINPRPPAGLVTLGALARMTRDSLPPGIVGGTS